MKKVLLAIILIVILGLAYYTISPFFRHIKMDEASPLTIPDALAPTIGEPTSNQPAIIDEAPLVAQAHEVEGKVQLIRVGDEYTVRFEDYKAINGPDLKIYLATDTNADYFLDLGDIKATEGNVNYPIPAGVYADEYDTVLVWCKAFGVLFSYAELGL